MAFYLYILTQEILSDSAPSLCPTGPDPSFYNQNHGILPVLPVLHFTIIILTNMPTTSINIAFETLEYSAGGFMESRTKTNVDENERGRKRTWAKTNVGENERERKRT